TQLFPSFLHVSKPALTCAGPGSLCFHRLEEESHVLAAVSNLVAVRSRQRPSERRGLWAGGGAAARGSQRWEPSVRLAARVSVADERQSALGRSRRTDVHPPEDSERRCVCVPFLYCERRFPMLPTLWRRAARRRPAGRAQSYRPKFDYLE